MSLAGSGLLTLGGMSLGWLQFKDGIGLLMVSWLPCMLAGAVLHLTRRGRHEWLVTLLTAYLIVVACSGVTVLWQSMRFGLDQVNVEGYMVWCWINALLLLPISWPMTWWLRRMVTC